AADPAFPGAARRTLRVALGRVPARPEPVLARCLGRLPPGDGLARRGALRAGAARLRQRSAPGGALVPLPLLRPRRAGLVRIRLGDPAPRDGIPRHLPLPAARRAALSTAPAADRRHLAASMDRLPTHTRRRADPAAPP